MGSMQRILPTRIKSLDLLVQGTTIYLEPRPKDVGFFLRESNLLRPVSRASHYQLLITSSRPIASKERKFSYWPAITTASTDVDCSLVLDGLTSIVAPMLSNSKAGGKVVACLIIDK